MLSRQLWLDDPSIWLSHFFSSFLEKYPFSTTITSKHVKGELWSVSGSATFGSRGKKQCTRLKAPDTLVVKNNLQMDLAPWCYKWDGIGMDGSPGGVKYRAPTVH